ncbi:TfuA-like protein [Roseibium sp. MMSF_3412]|uniref:TfuA-like protein n=1 Tax=Roseibium sp. MMSF_3412 TaxID=3046712 RepID=UPI00273F551F|nr:TfuA-like protein [Roseibium sp. MMSF_3412]
MKTRALPVIVFAGPSVIASEFPEDLQAHLSPPAAQGDIVAAVLRHGPCVIALIDGFFQGVPAVRHKEILWAISRGAIVFGAASMGALRAAELWTCGMHGRGLIFRWLRRFPLLPDDAVAVLHAPPELGAGSLTEALVDLRQGIKRARRSGTVSAGIAHELLLRAQDLHYTERTFTKIADGLPPQDRADVVAGIRRSGRSQKKQDALNLLNELRARQQHDDWPAPSSAGEFVFTDAFLHDLAESGFPIHTLDVH